MNITSCWRHKQRIFSNNDHLTPLLNTRVWLGGIQSRSRPIITRPLNATEYSIWQCPGCINLQCNTLKVRFVVTVWCTQQCMNVFKWRDIPRKGKTIIEGLSIKILKCTSKEDANLVTSALWRQKSACWGKKRDFDNFYHVYQLQFCCIYFWFE